MLVKKSVPDIFDGYLSNHERGLYPLALPCCAGAFTRQHRLSAEKYGIIKNTHTIISYTYVNVFS